MARTLYASRWLNIHKPFSWARDLHDYGSIVVYTIFIRIGPGPQDYLRWAKFLAADTPRPVIAAVLRTWRWNCRRKAREYVIPSAQHPEDSVHGQEPPALRS